MANTTALYARIDSNLKKNAEDVLSCLGITPASAIQMFYSQIILNGGLPFQPVLPVRKPIAIGTMSQAEIDAELMKGIHSMKNGEGFSPDQIDDDRPDRTYLL